MTQDHRRVREIQQTLQQAGGLSGWLFYDFRGSDPLAYRVLHLDPKMHVTRRWYYWVPTKGEPVQLVHRIEPHTLNSLPGRRLMYVSWEEQKAHLAEVLRGAVSVAMQYSPLNAVPYVSRVDAGTVELIRSFGVEVTTSADLVQRFEAVWNDQQLLSHREAAEKLRLIVEEAFAKVGSMVKGRSRFSEYDLQQYILSCMRRHGLVTSSAPIAAVNQHSADPHYSPSPDGSSPIGEGDLVLIDLWAKRPEPASVYADITWTGYVGSHVPARQQDIFRIVRDARDAALSFVQSRVQGGAFPLGWEVDEVCRAVIRSAGYEDRFLHRTGHSIGEEVHGNGANIDNLETRDERQLIAGTCFSIEPGIYLHDEFGIRSELDVYLSEREAFVFGQPVQTEVVSILAE